MEQSGVGELGFRGLRARICTHTLTKTDTGAVAGQWNSGRRLGKRMWACCSAEELVWFEEFGGGMRDACRQWRGNAGVVRELVTELRVFPESPFCTRRWQGLMSRECGGGIGGGLKTQQQWDG